MIPYFEWRTIPIGHVILQVWGLFAATGVILGAWFGSRWAKRSGIEPSKFEGLAFWTIIGAFIGARVFHVLFYDPTYYLGHPLEIISVWKGGLSSFGGFIGGGAAAAWKMYKHRLPYLKTADIVTVSATLGLGCGRVGCFLIHDHPGTLAYGIGRILAVNYKDAPRYDLGLLLSLFDFILFGAFILLMRKPRKEGFYLALFLVVYSPVRFLLDFLRLLDARYLGLTPAQYGCVALFIAGVALMVRLYHPKYSRNAHEEG
jgi:phosphatidylglycerol:prolipoprotein diacylglycerol transferase